MSDLLHDLAKAIRREEEKDEHWLVESASPPIAVESARAQAVLSPWRRRIALGGVGAVAAAAMMAFALRAAAPIPPYRVEARAGETPSRAPDAVPSTSLVLRPDNHLLLVLRPETEVEGVISVKAFLTGASGTRAFDAPFEIAETGLVRLAGRTDDLFRDVPPGGYDLVVFIGREAHLPKSAADVDATAASTSREVRVVRRAIVLDRHTP